MFFPVSSAPCAPPPPTKKKGFLDLMPHQSPFVYKIVLEFIFSHSPFLPWRCRCQGTQAAQTFSKYAWKLLLLGPLPSLFPDGKSYSSLKTWFRCHSHPAPPSPTALGGESPVPELRHPFPAPPPLALSGWVISSLRGQNFIPGEQTIIFLMRKRYTNNT